MLATDKIRADFPIFKRQINGHPLIYLDNAATSQKPQVVINALVDFYQNHNANVHRGIHTLGDEATQLYQAARANLARFIGASDPNEIVFVRNTTEAINLVAFSWGLAHLKPDDEIIVTELEHHSNLLPWQRLCRQTGAKLLHLPLDNNGDLAFSYLKSLVGQRVKLVAFSHVSNVLGTIIDIQHLARDLKHSAPHVCLLADGAQSTPHLPIHVKDLHVDFFCFSGHKMLGPMGIGVLWAKKAILETMEPFLVGGGMISQVKPDSAEWADLPDRFEAGTPNVAGAIGLSVASDYLQQHGLQNIRDHEQDLTTYALQRFVEMEKQGLVTLYGLRDPNKRAAIFTFNLTGVHAHDVAQILDRECGIAVRSGHHCNQPLMEKLDVPATVRASFYLYNTRDEIDALINGLHLVRKVFKLT
ncbi:cysteine desulfurase [Microgenomates group bacterium RBG_16_45_19]|nr:MAG: cysteine desulfurase [Microgenomates group bacterium RBG_16_45_19]